MLKSYFKTAKGADFRKRKSEGRHGKFWAAIRFDSKRQNSRKTNFVFKLSLWLEAR